MILWDRLVRVFSFVGGAVLLSMVLLVAADVILRRVFNSPLAFSLELVEIMLTIVIVSYVAYATAVSRHVSISLVVSRFPQKARTIIDAVTDFPGAILFGVICWQSIVMTMNPWERGYVSGILHIPYYPFRIIMSVGMAFASLVLLVRFVNLIIGRTGK